MSTTVFLIHDNALMRKGLAAVVTSQPDTTLIGFAEHGREAIRLVRGLRPGVVIMGFRSHDANSIGEIAEIAEVCPCCRIIVLSSTCRLEHATWSFGAGARGYVSLGSPDELIKAVRAVHIGCRYVTPRLLACLRYPNRPYFRVPEIWLALAALSTHDREIAQLVDEGWSNREIAERYHVSLHAVRVFLRRLNEWLHGSDPPPGVEPFVPPDLPDRIDRPGSPDGGSL